MTTNERVHFVASIILGCREAHENAINKGFVARGELRNPAEMIALIHSEVSEALEYLRHGNPPDDKVPEFNGVEAELADTVIRVFDFAAEHNMRLGEAIVAKMEYNATRPPKHGKHF